MATKNMAYDNAAYLAITPLIEGTIGAGAAATSGKIAAFTQLLVKSIQLTPATAGTSNDVVSSIQISGTTTTTTAITTYGSAVATTTNVVSTATLAQGDIFYIVKGADATVQYASMVEGRIVPTANVTA